MNGKYSLMPQFIDTNNYCYGTSLVEYLKKYICIAD